MLKIYGDKVILKEFTKENLYDERYFSWLRDIEIITQIYRLDYLLPLDFSNVEEYVKSLWNSKNDCFFAVYYKENDQFIGTIKIGHINWRTGIADLGIMIGEKDFRGKGLSEDIMICAIKYAFKTLSLRKLTGGTSALNVAMQKCFEKLGFIKEGVIRSQLLIDGEYIDHILYGIFKSEFNIYL